MKRISRRELLLQAFALIAGWICLALVAVDQELAASIPQALIDSLTFQGGLVALWIFPLLILICYNFLAALIGMLRSRSAKLGKTSIALSALIALLLSACLVLPVVLEKRNERIFRQAVHHHQGYRVLAGAGVNAADLQQGIREISHQGDAMVIAMTDGSRLLVVINHHRKSIAVQND